MLATRGEIDENLWRQRPEPYRGQFIRRVYMLVHRGGRQFRDHIEAILDPVRLRDHLVECAGELRIPGARTAVGVDSRVAERAVGREVKGEQRREGSAQAVPA